MGRNRLFAPLLLALSGLGWSAAHALAHRLTAADAGAPKGAFHAYAAYLPTSFALCLALALALAAAGLLGRRRRLGWGRSLWLFAVVPVLGFVGHAVLEPLLVGSASWAGMADKAVAFAPLGLVGLLAQVPFALVAVALGRRILVIAECVALAFARRGPEIGARAAERRPRAPRGRVPLSRLDACASPRGPPLPSPA